MVLCGPTGVAGTAAWPYRPGVRLSETAIAFARSCSCGIETAIAFAGAKWAFLARFSGAEAMPVSRLPCLGVSRGDAGFSGPLLGASSGVVGFNVATLSRLVREKVRPACS